MFTQLNRKNHIQNIGIKFNIPLIRSRAREPATLYAEFAIKNIIDLQRPCPNNIQIDDMTLEKNWNLIPIILTLIWATLLSAINFFTSLHSIILKQIIQNPTKHQTLIKVITLKLIENKLNKIKRP